MVTINADGYPGMMYADEEQSRVTLQVRHTDSGTIEVVRTSASGTTVHFDTPEDALRRVSAWISGPAVSPTDTAHAVATVSKLRLPAASQPNIVRPFMGLDPTPATYGRVVCISGTIEVRDPEADERRSEARFRASDMNWLSGARSTYGADIRVLDISSNGILIETDHELNRDTTIGLELFGRDGALRVASRVVRSRRCVQGDIVWYQTGCRFRRPVDLGGFVPQFVKPSVPLKAVTVHAGGGIGTAQPSASAGAARER